MTAEWLPARMEKISSEKGVKGSRSALAFQHDRLSHRKFSLVSAPNSPEGISVSELPLRPLS